LDLSRREALWAIKALRDDPLPLFAAADAREGQLRPEFDEPAVVLDPMTLGQEVVEDYRNKGLSLRRHPVSFLRRDLAAGGSVPCATLARARDRSRITVAGLVLVRQMPGSAKGVMFITLEDETDVANLVIWPSLFERQRRLVLSAGMLGCRGRVQREGHVVHLVAEHLIDHSDLLRTVAMRDEVFPLPRGRGDEACGGGGPDERMPTRAIYIPDLQIESGLKIRTRDFR
jgi:error-prone DNA polymerase